MVFFRKRTQNSPINLDEIENLYAYPEYYGKYASFAGGTEEERDAEIERLKQLVEDTTDLQDYPDEIDEEISGLEELETEMQEIFEWWAVSSFLAEDLKKQGEPVCDTGSVWVWGRTTTGQAILLDGVISRICSDMEILDGQKYSWAKK